MLDINKDKYIIVEIIPTNNNKDLGEIIQIQALKINGLKLIKRFDYRLNLDLIKIPDLRNMLDYDRDNFTYKDNSKDILDEFKTFIEDYPLLIIDNSYTRDYLSSINNNKESIFKYLDMDLTDDVFDKLIAKYSLVPSNHLVDLLYEGLIQESNK